MSDCLLEALENIRDHGPGAMDAIKAKRALTPHQQAAINDMAFLERLGGLCKVIPEADRDPTMETVCRVYDSIHQHDDAAQKPVGLFNEEREDATP